VSPSHLTATPLPELRLPLAPGEHVDEYQVVGEVGRGGMAMVYAVQKCGPGGFGKLLALKIVLPHLASDEHAARMVLDEARIAASIHHPNVVEVLDVGSARGVPYIAMEFLRGRSLAAVLRKGGLSRGALFHVLAQAASGLGAAHRACALDGAPLGIIHRDVSPQNVHVGYNGVAKLVDFGIASARGRLAETRSDVLKGKLAYLAPEQLLRNVPIGNGVDIWALGVVVWEALSRRRLFHAPDEGSTLWRILNDDVPALSSVVADAPKAITRLVARCLERDPAARISDAAEISRELLVAARAEGVHSIEDVAAEVQRLFAVELAVEEDRLRTALSGSPRVLREAEPASSFEIATPIRERPKRRVLIGLAASVGVVVAGVAVFTSMRGSAPPSRSIAPSSAARAPPPIQPPPPAAPAPSVTSATAASARPPSQKPVARPSTTKRPTAQKPERVGPLQKNPYGS
jgi:eukaryotic-like serine/threonine-protein kinase